MKKIKVFIFKKILFILLIIVLAIALLLIFQKSKNSRLASAVIEETPTPTATPTIEPTPTISITPTPTPISFEDMNKKFGPCVRVEVLTYHHIQAEEEAKTENQTGLSVDPIFFREHLQYLKDKNYTVIGAKDLINFFNGLQQLSGKIAMITLDDGYGDNYSNAYPILKEFGFKAIIFTPTGLVNNPDYLTWDEINQMKDLVYFANHTWSHHNQSGSAETITKEISLADTQLKDKGLNDQKIFAYPYGSTNQEEINILKNYGYNLAFTTKHGNIMCKGKSFELPRIRVGNAPLSQYGL